MPRGFSEQEKINIKTRLMEKGKEAFGLYGIKKTSVEDLAKESGISKGAFYQFFSSKEELYFSILSHYEKEMQAGIFQNLTVESTDERALLKSILKSVMDQVDKDPFFKRLLEKKEIEYLWQKFTPEQLEQAMETDIDFASKLVENWKNKGKLKVDDPKLVTGVFRAVFMMYLHKQDIGEDVFDSVVDILLDSAIEKLIES